MITSFELHKLRMPVGRAIGDNSCSYERFDVAALALRTSDGLTGWGYGTAMSDGYFERTGWWIRIMPAEAAMRAEFESATMPALRSLNCDEDWLSKGIELDAGFGAVTMALRQALWDLAAKQAKLPLWRWLAKKYSGISPPDGAAPQVPAYGSLLDFGVPEEAVAALLHRYLEMGMGAIKVKIGAGDARRDLRRLRLISDAVGPTVQLFADANEVWDSQTCISRLRYFHHYGIRLRYIEDPLPRDDLAGFLALRGHIPCEVGGHDYFERYEQWEDFILKGALDVVRSGQNTAIQCRVARLCAEKRLPIFYGNSIGELNVHAAAALPGTERIEYSHVGWTALFATPVQVVNGFMIPPAGDGFGLDPKPEALREFHHPVPSERISRPCPWVS